MVRRAMLLIVMAAGLLGAPVGGARGELAPIEVAVVAARGSQPSEELARYYIKARGLPADNLCLVDMPRGEICPREQWTWAIRPEIRKWLEEHDPKRRLRCLVTVWDVPLKVGPAEMDAERHRYRQFLEGERKNRLDLIGKIAAQLDQILPSISVPNPPPGEQIDAAGAPKTAAQKELTTRQANLERALQRAQAKVAKLPQGEQRNLAGAQIQQFATIVGGARVLLQGIERQVATQQQKEDAPPELRSQFDLLRGRAGAFTEIKMMLDQFPAGYEHDALELAALERNGGLLATIEWLNDQLSIVQKNETGASFDSELSLVMWPDDYELLRWQPNYLRDSYANSELGDAFRTLMVSRLDGPTVDIARRLVDDSLKAEKEGLHGKVYLDSRGMAKAGETTPVAPGSYADFDRALLVMAEGLRNLTNLEVVLNSGPELFKAGECPDAALYCGWYSLAKYVDAFEWAPGAVGYHLASSEASTLRDPGSQAWCKKMLEDGVAATMGPVYEPYLAAFPRPDEFFSHLVAGESTLVECYYRTLPFNSWMMTLVGDPLYRPFKNHPVARAGGPPAAVTEGASKAPAAEEPIAPSAE